jgi:hypothetical protein
MLTGYNPYVDLTTEYDIFEKIVKVPLADPRTKYPAVSEHMVSVIDKSTQKNPLDRFNSCNDFSKGLDNKNADELLVKNKNPEIENPINNSYESAPPQKKKINPLAIIIPLALILLTAIGWYWNNQSKSGDEAIVVTDTTSSVDGGDVSDSDKKEEEKVETPDPQTAQQAPVAVPDSTAAVAPINQSNNGVINLVVYGNDLEDLRNKLKAKSNAIMKNKGYNPENVSFDPIRHRFSCDLVPSQSLFTKLSLVFGPISDGCPACDNVIIKNPGSEVLVNESDANYIYNIISIAE